MPESVVLAAFLWGLISAVSLPLGAVIGLSWKPRQKINSAFMAFGAGALLFALTIELFSHVPHHVHEYGIWALVASVGSAIMGGLLFDLLNTLLNNKGAFMRKLSSARRYVTRLRDKRVKRLLSELGRITALKKLPPQKMAELIRSVDEVEIEPGSAVFKQGDEAQDMYFIISGEVKIILHEEGAPDREVAILKNGDTFGEMGIVMGVPRTADAVALSYLRLYKLSKIEFDELIKDIPELRDELQELADQRLTELYIKEEGVSDRDWQDETLNLIHMNMKTLSIDDLKMESEHAGGSNAALAIWLGILIDGIPESFIIGILALKSGGMSLAFIAGVFLANLPEAMSSAVSMAKGGMKIKKIMIMWGSLCLMTGIGAAVGAVLFPAEPTGMYFYVILGIEGLAAGAMLTMIAETMLPEAYEQGGTIVGLSTLLGFIAALLVKIYG